LRIAIVIGEFRGPETKKDKNIFYSLVLRKGSSPFPDMTGSYWQRIGALFRFLNMPRICNPSEQMTVKPMQGIMATPCTTAGVPDAISFRTCNSLPTTNKPD
jgi:hypothetical protein